MSDKIAEIRARYAGYSLNSGNAAWANEDRGWLLVEVERQRAEIERQRAEIERLRENVDRAGKEVERADRLRAEIARVKSDDRKNRAENERLRAALTSIASNTCCGGCQEAARVARNALEGKS